MGKFIDIHTHHPNALNIAVLNRFAQDESELKSNTLYSIGFHPWHLDKHDNGLAIEKLKSLAGNPRIVAIGECGIDRAIDISIGRQEQIFTEQIEIAEKANKPLIIHSVKSYSDLIRIKKSSRAKTPWILHGYTGNKQTTGQLIAHGFYFSFGAALLKDKTRLPESLKLIPLDKLFFETDESPKKIETIYTFAAKTLQLPLEELKANIHGNFKSVFKNG